VPETLGENFLYLALFSCRSILPCQTMMWITHPAYYYGTDLITTTSGVADSFTISQMVPDVPSEHRQHLHPLLHALFYKYISRYCVGEIPTMALNCREKAL
jgi:hypothetical protein